MVLLRFDAAEFPVKKLSPEYIEYIGSEAWAKKREERLSHDGHRCQHCGAMHEAKPLQVHHLTYRRFGNELLSDLLSLCHDCHKAADAERRRRAGRRLRLRRY